jgi:outer membrane protein insertion porin family
LYFLVYFGGQELYNLQYVILEPKEKEKKGSSTAMGPINWRYFRFVFVILVILSVSVSGLGAEKAAPAAPPRNVVDIQIKGNHEVKDAFIRQQIKNVKLKQPLNMVELQKDLDNLKLTGKFTEVFATTRQEGSNIVVIFQVVERPAIQTIRFQGAKKVKEKDLAGLLEFKAGDPLDTLKVKSGIQVILQKYRDEGYNEASVTLDEKALEEGTVNYIITEGPRVRVTKILFEGQRTFTPNRLAGQIETKTYVWIFRPGTYAENQIQDDIVSLRTFYRKEGFLDVQVGRKLDFDPERQRLTVTFVINEGIRYSVSKIEIEGFKHFPKEQIISCMQLVSGSTLNLDQLEGDRKSILRLYNGEGYVYAGVETIYTYAETAGTVNLKIRITEGEPYKIGRIIIRGNKKTQDRVIRRTLDFYPTQTFDLNKMQDRERRLKETRLFKDASIKPVPGDIPDERDALIQLEESDTTKVMAGVGVTSNSGVVGTFSIENWNFNIWDKPRTMGEFFRGQAFKGAGQTLKFSFEPGTQMTSFRIDFTEPYLFDLPITFGWSAYLFDRNRDGYDEGRVGTIFSLGKRFKDIYTVNSAFRFEGVKIDNIDKHLWFFAPEDVLAAAGNNMLTSLKLSITRDTTDSFMVPTRGTRVTGSWEQAGVFGGDSMFSKVIGDATYFKTLRTDIYDRKTVWSSNVTAGYIGGDCPLYERFYGGGIGSVRGFKFRGISPRQWPSDTQVGGNSEFLVGNEIEFPLAGKVLRGVTFLDMGTVSDNFVVDAWRMSVGFGVRLTIDFFGPVPMAFDFGFPISKGPDDDTQIFSFSLGTTFK